MSEDQHYFEDQENMPVRFVGEDLWDMDEYYSELVPEMGLPVQVIITAKINGKVLEIHTLEIAPEGCEDQLRNATGFIRISPIQSINLMMG